MKKKVVSYLVAVATAFVVALNYQLFVFPNSFAPAGVNGLLTIIQHLFGFKLSFASIILNVPLAIAAYIWDSKPRALRALTYVLSFSVFLLLLDMVDLSAFVYSTTISALLGPAVAGLITGVGGYIMFSMGGHLGGTEYVAGFVQKRFPRFNFFTIVLVINVSVAVLSYFVYDYKIEPVLLCIIYSYFSSSIRDTLNRRSQQALRCEIVTDQPEELGEEIIHSLHHTATVIQGRGLYSGQEKTVLLCLVNTSQVTELGKLIEKYPGSFVVISHASSVIGNFKHLDSRSRPEREFFDKGKPAASGKS